MCETSADFYTLDQHTMPPDMLVISARVWKNLPDEFKQILQEAVDESVVYQRKIWAEAVEKDMKTVQEAGVKVIYPDKKPFQDAVKKVWDEFINADNPQDAEIGKLIQRIQEVK